MHELAIAICLLMLIVLCWPKSWRLSLVLRWLGRHLCRKPRRYYTRGLSSKKDAKN